MSITFCLVLAVSLLVLWLYLRWRRVRSYWAERGVPHSPPHFIFGSLTFLQTINMSEYLREEYQKFSGYPYFGIWLFWRPALVVRDPQLARHVLVKDFDAFHDRFLNSGRSDPVGGLNIFTANDPLWSSIRRRLTPVFTAAKLRALHPLVEGKAENLLKRIQRDHVESEGGVDLRDMFTDYTTDVIGTASFGLASDATLSSSSTLRSITRSLMQVSLARGIEFACIFFLPELCDIFRVKFFTKKITSFFRSVFHQIVEQRGGWDAPVTQPVDLVDTLLKLRQDSKRDGEEINKDIIVAQAAIFLMGGFDTTAVALSYATYELAFHPHIQDKLYAEISKAKSKAGGDLDLKAVADLPYLNCVIKETLRKYSAMGWLDRVTSREYRLGDVTLQAGTPVYVCAVGMHYDPEYYPEPDSFRPERFDEATADVMPFTYMPFGEGPRMCIGMRFAYQTMRAALSRVVEAYILQPPPDAPHPRDLHIEPQGMFLAPDRTLGVNFIPRN